MLEDTSQGCEVVRVRAARPPAVGDLDRVVATIRELTRATALSFAIEVGRLVVDAFYDGNVEALRMRGLKNASLRKLAARPDLAMSATALYRCIAIYEVCTRLGDVGTWKHLGASHVRAVLGLPSEQQAFLLQSAERERWSVARLVDGAQATMTSEVIANYVGLSRGGRKRASRVTKGIAAIRRACVVLTQAFEEGAPSSLPPRGMAEVEAALDTVIDTCERLRATLRTPAGTAAMADEIATRTQQTIGADS